MFDIFLIANYYRRKSPMVTEEKDILYLGIDIGSVSLCYVIINQDRKIVHSEYIFHRGDIFSALQEHLSSIDFSKVQNIAFNHKSSDFFNQGLSVNEQIALIEGVRFQVKNVGAVFTIGGETFGLILFDENGRYQKYISNSSCAAGTGAFLDQQAERLGLAGSAELSQLAESFHGEPPKIATRCAVFAKTDLIHCQQQGYSVQAISAGLCKGLAHNITDTLVKGVKLRQPVVAVGGVSKNVKVMQYISEIIGSKIIIPENAELIGAMGCAIMAQSQKPGVSFSFETLLKEQNKEKLYFFPPLKAELTIFPNFEDHKNYILHNVEVDLYNVPQQPGVVPVFLGIDIGSTSTKAVVLDARKKEQNILLGLYTRTRGQPITATQDLLQVLREIEEKYGIEFDFFGVGTTGSGRKFIQKVISAEMAIDEITAHARAAYALNPKVDTIIEIGGQDSKFTVMKDGQVTFSVMNYVCAAGTGSFIEEQAKRLNVPLSDYAEQAIGKAAPLTSDRCTVFMERDLNSFISQGFSRQELLAAVLHSVRDNYLSKVAHLNKIGNVICFQGATAKNHALVMAFEQKLQKPIFVSKYCHLTGALGVCLLLKEENIEMLETEKSETLKVIESSVITDTKASKKILKSKFRGIDFYKESPEVLDEVCDGCKNHCKLKRIKMTDGDVVWGYLCGRDDSDNSRKTKKKSGFNLLSNRRKVFNAGNLIEEKISFQFEKEKKSIIAAFKRLNLDISLEKLKQIHFSISLDKIKHLNLDVPIDKLKQSFSMNVLELRHRIYAFTQEEIQSTKEKIESTIGIPNALYLLEFVPFWQLFFKKLGHNVIISRSDAEFIEKGKEIAGAEFCAPIAYWHGHVHNLCKNSDYMFLPHMFQNGDADVPKLYCYYSNYAVALVQNIEELNLKAKCIAPIIDFTRPTMYNIRQFYESLPHDLKLIHTPSEIRKAYVEAWQWFIEQRQQLVSIFQHQQNLFDDISVVLLGRPYLILDAGINKNIPQKFNELGISTYYQDMLPLSEIQLDEAAKEFINWNHWKFGEQILKSAEYICQNHELYPVILTAFKCSPDSFVLNYFKEIMDNYGKPYLILQIDEHGSDIGYETRIEAATRSFRNHYHQKGSAVKTKAQKGVLRKYNRQGTVLIPNYDRLSCSLICAAFENGGYHSLLIEETETSIQSSLRLNDGQCLPISAIASGAIETIQKYNLEPDNTAIFLNAITRLSCNFPQYPLMMKQLLEQRGDGFENVKIFATEFEMRGLPFELIYDVYCSYLLGGLVRKIGCKIRPYEVVPGKTYEMIEVAHQKLYRCIARCESKEEVFKDIIKEFQKIPMNKSYGNRPKVSIIGDLYVRDNDVFNQQLIAELENYGAEIVVTPFTYILRMLAIKHNYRLWEDGSYLKYLRDKLLIEVLEKFERRFFHIANEIIQEEFLKFDDSIFKELEKYSLSLQHGGETAQNIMKIYSLLDHYPELKLFIHVNPIFCCPGLVSESIFKKVEKDIGIPIVSITYDGTTANRNKILAPYLHYISDLIKSKEESDVSEISSGLP